MHPTQQHMEACLKQTTCWDRMRALIIHKQLEQFHVSYMIILQ